ncbi:hypothetical protein DYQ86_22260 [Acidobacteria bacterium AB60]|nr:hypothetical protein DYQ86_22260 [Acidobacteria bacterium AB60]
MNTKSESLFEDFLAAHNLPFEKICEDSTPRPDYRVSLSSSEIIFELKELSEDENFGVVKDPAYPHIKSSSRTMGEHVRRRIESSKKQIQYGAKLGVPSVLLIYNNIDPVFQDFGTEAMDFTAAMYGAYTILIDRESKTSSDWFNGKDRMLQENKNTSFSAVGHLCDRGGTTTVTLYENVFAKVKVLYAQLPPCFNLRRIDISTAPLDLP